jgi:hypothetical protein
MNWSPAKIKKYVPPPKPLTRSERSELKRQQKVEKELKDAQYIEEIERLQRRLAAVQLKKQQKQYQSSSKYDSNLQNSYTSAQSSKKQEGKDPAFFTVLSPVELVTCEECGVEVPINQINKHHITNCVGRYTSCRKPGCKSRFREVDRVKHEKYECKTVAKNNKYVIAALKRSLPIECPLGCNMYVMTKDMPRHRNMICKNRKITCPGCDMKLLINDMKIHTATKCKVITKRNIMAESSNQRRLVPIQCSPHHEMGCGQMILPKDMKKHEKVDCPNRLTLCSNKGCNEMIPYNILSFHENNTCKAMLKRRKDEMEKEENSKLEYACPLDCGEYMFTNETSNHIKNECNNRIVTCSVVGCGKKMKYFELNSHEMIWERRIEQASQKFYFVNPDTDETLWDDPGCKLLRLRDFFLEKYLSKPKIILCKLGCRTVLKNNIKIIRNHLLNDCPNEIITCKSKGKKCMKTMLRRKFNEHYETECIVGKRMIKLAKKGLAQRMLINCPYCSIEMQIKHLKRHTNHECPRRLVPCKYWDCEVKCPANGWSIHVLTECDHRKKWEEGVAAARERVRISGGKPFLPNCFRDGSKGKDGDNDDDDDNDNDNDDNGRK